MGIDSQLDDALRPFSEGKPDAPQNERTRRVAGLVQTAIMMLGDEYRTSNAWDRWPKSCHIFYNIGKRDAEGWWYRLGSLSYRDLHYKTDAALVAELCEWLPRMFEDHSGPAEKDDDRGCL